MRSLVTSIFLYACESWTLTEEIQRIQAWKWRATARYYASHTKTICYQRGSPCQDPAGNRATRRPPDHCKKMQTSVVWSCFPFIRSGQNHLARGKWKGEEDKMDKGRSGKTTLGNGQAWSLASPRGQWRTGAPTTLAVKGLMMMMMIVHYCESSLKKRMCKIVYLFFQLRVCLDCKSGASVQNCISLSVC